MNQIQPFDGFTASWGPADDYPVSGLFVDKMVLDNLPMIFVCLTNEECRLGLRFDIPLTTWEDKKISVLAHDRGLTTVEFIELVNKKPIRLS